MESLKSIVNSTTLNLCVRTKVAMRNARDKLREKGGSFFTEHALAIVITVAIAGIVLVAVVMLFKDKIFPGLSNKTDEFFNVN